MKTLSRILGLVGLITLIVVAYTTATEPFAAWPAFDTPTKALIAEFSFFTQWSNIIGTIYLLRGAKGPRWFRVDAVAMLTITGIIFNTLLKGDELHGSWVYTSKLQHIFMPIAVLLIWLLTTRKRPIFTLPNIIGALVIPIAWSVLTFVRGAQTGWYPYYFIDASHLGFERAFINMLGVYAGFFVLSIVLGIIERIIIKVRRDSATAAKIGVASSI